MWHSIQHQLLAELELTFERALKVAQAIETASRDVRELPLQPKTVDSNVSNVAAQCESGTEVAMQNDTTNVLWVWG